MKLTYNCPICNKQLILKSEHVIGNNTLYEYKCGHMFSKTLHKWELDTATLDFTSTDGAKHARPYQAEGIEFILNSDFNCIVADQMRLGKTPQSLLALKNKMSERTPCLIIVKGANLWQWTEEFKTWVTTLPLGIYPIIGSKAWIPPGFSAYIISMDTFSRPKVQESLKQIAFKLVIVDEAHSFKNPESNRSQALVDFISFMNTGEESKEIKFTCNRCQHEWTEIGKRKYDKRFANTVISKNSKCPKCFNYVYINQQHKIENTDENKPCGIVLLTGTPILNRAEEFFIPLNLVAPEKFNSLEGFRRRWLTQDPRTGKYDKVKPYYLEEFKREIKPYLIRREKEDVYKDLPPINRIYTLIEPDKDTLVTQYNKILDKLEESLASKVNPNFWDMQGELMELRRICGMMKVMWTADYLEMCLLDSEKQRFAVGIHHETVRDVLYMKLGGEQNCLKFSGEDNADRKFWVMKNFQTSKQRVLIINMLAGGVGMDFHYCNNITVLERQWNSAIEEQFEFRFYNPDKSIKTDPTNIEYILIKGSFDHWWHDMIEGKKKIFGETVANHWDLQNDQVSFRELMEQTVSSRL